LRGSGLNGGLGEVGAVSTLKLALAIGVELLSVAVLRAAGRAEDDPRGVS
jgi:hypothetical protein